MKKIFIFLLLLISFLVISCDETTNNDEKYLRDKMSEILDNIPSSVENDLSFVNSLDDCLFTWSTDKENIISNDGKVTRQDSHEAVKITLDGQYKDVSLIKTKNVIVLKKEDTPIDEIDCISKVLSSELGMYVTKGLVIACNAQSFLIKDDTGMILVYKGKTWSKDVEIGDEVKVSGTTSLYGKAKQFGSDTVYEKVGNGEVSYGEPTILNATDLDNYATISNIAPKYIKVIGTLNVSGSYYNINFEGAGIVGSISYPINTNELDLLNGKMIEVYGYVTGTSGSDKYLNIMTTSFNEYIDELDPEFTRISKVLSSTLGEYKVKGTVVGINKQSFLVKDTTASILVYRGSEWNPDVSVGDIVEVSGVTVKYYNSVQFTTDAIYEVVGAETATLGIFKKLSYADIEYYSSLDPMPVVYGEVEGVLSRSGSYYNIDFGGSIIGSIAYPFDSYTLDELDGKKIAVEGFITSLRSNYLSILMTDFEEIVENTDTFDLHILEINDIHGYCEQDEYGSNGLSNMAYLINNIRDANPLDDVVLIGAGDMFQGTAISNITHGLTMVNAMNAMDFDCMIIGNHEFDWELDVILKYFDGNKDNGEADFPLLNANIYNKSDNTLVTIDNGNIFESTVVEREGVEIGIIGYIGDVYTSINYVMAKDYYFDLDIASSVSKIGGSLKDQGVDVIVVAVHGGNSSSIENYNVNKSISNLMYDDDYLVDAVINAHTHTRQTGYINRYNGTPLPLVQGGGNGQLFGEIVLSLDKETNNVVSVLAKTNYASSAGSNYDEEVEEVIQKAIKDNYDILNEVYCVAGETVNNKGLLQQWVGNVLVSATGSDIAICNTGGLRSTGDIISGENITIANMYMINPFDNFMMIVEVSGKDIVNFIESNAVFYGSKVNLNSISSSNEKFRVAVVDYVYYWDSFPQNASVINSNLIMRDILIEDLKLRSTFQPISFPEALVGNLLENNTSKTLNLNVYKHAILRKLEELEYLL